MTSIAGSSRCSRSLFHVGPFVILFGARLRPFLIADESHSETAIATDIHLSLNNKYQKICELFEILKKKLHFNLLCKTDKILVIACGLVNLMTPSIAIETGKHVRKNDSLFIVFCFLKL